MTDGEVPEIAVEVVPEPVPPGFGAFVPPLLCIEFFQVEKQNFDGWQA